MLQLFQETVPFSNKRLDKQISQNATFTNPIIMSWAFDFTVCSNILEVVFYVRNDMQTDCYSNIIVSLMKEDSSIISPTITSGTIHQLTPLSDVAYTVNGYTGPVGFSTEVQPQLIQDIVIPNSYNSNYIPVISDIDPVSKNKIETDDSIGVKFSYGYDEVSSVDWESKHSILCIPNIGTRGTAANPFGNPDTSYHPIRARITWKKQATLLTIRDYFIDVSFERKEVI